MVFLRTCKAEVIAGLSSAQVHDLQQRDPAWLTNGEWGVIQFVPGPRLTLCLCEVTTTAPAVAPAEEDTREAYQERDGQHLGSTRVSQTTSQYTCCLS
jgi:hypothetical protein